MKYVKLSIARGGMAREVARHQMQAAKQRCRSHGELILSQPNRNGFYYAGFSNPAHAAEFVRYCQAYNIVHETLNALPGNNVMQPQSYGEAFMKAMRGLLGTTD